MQLGGVGVDNDSCSLKSMRKAVDHEIFKHSDENRTSKGVVKAIKYLQKYFDYSVAQCNGNSEILSASLKNIPYHSFNMHANCGNWYGYIKDPQNYRHKVIGDGFTDPNLWEELECLNIKLKQYLHKKEL